MIPLKMKIIFKIEVEEEDVEEDEEEEDSIIIITEEWEEEEGFNSKIDKIILMMALHLAIIIIGVDFNQSKELIVKMRQHLLINTFEIKNLKSKNKKNNLNLYIKIVNKNQNQK
jgi:hypothetical protein